MITYWLTFMIPAFVSLSPLRGTRRLQGLAWLLIGTLLVFLIGLRYKVGGDWFTYLEHYHTVIGMPFLDALRTSDPGYAAVNWLGARFDLQIYTVNLVCALIFVIGLIKFCRQQPLPWLALAVSVPYLVTVVAMGYTRQAVAIGFLFLALSELRNTNQFRYIAWVILAALFHKTAVFLLPLGVLISTRHRALKTFAIVSLFALLGGALVGEYYDALWRNYVEAGMASDGGAIRVWMNACAALALFVSATHWKKRWEDTSLWKWLALLALVSVPLVGFASTAVDRMAIYLIPLQMVVFSRLPVLISDVVMRTLVVIGTLLVYGAVLWVWLNHGTHAQYWLPYRNIALLFLTD